MTLKACWLWLLAVLLFGLSSPLSARPAPHPFEPSAFADAQAQGRTILVETYAGWCLPCRIQAPILNRLRSQAEFSDVLIFRIGEVSSREDWKRFDLHGYGMLVLFKGEREVARGSPMSADAVTKLLRSP